MKIRALACSLTLALSVVGLVAPSVGAAPGAPAAKPSVKISNISTKTAPYKGKVTIKPKASVSGKATITKLRITVRRGNAKGKIVSRNAKSTKLAAGTYHLTTTASYRQYKVTTKTVPYENQYLVYYAGDLLDADCSIVDPFLDAELYTDEQFAAQLSCVPSQTEAAGSFQSSTTVHDLGDGTWGVENYFGDLTLVEAPSRSDLLNKSVTIATTTPEDLYVIDRGTEVVQTKTPYGATLKKTRTQKLIVRKGAKPRSCATLTDFRSVLSDFDDAASYGDSKATVAAKLHNKGRQTSYTESPGQILEFRRYPGCSGGSFMSVGFENGYAYTKSYYK